MPTVERTESANEAERLAAGFEPTMANTPTPTAFNEEALRFPKYANKPNPDMIAALSADTGIPASTKYSAMDVTSNTAAIRRGV